MVVLGYNYDLATRGEWNFITVGAFLFYISDSVLAINKFVGGIPNAQLMVMTTYYTAQYSIAVGFLNRLKF
jgi:uncharacterized membrane protein YhhN